MRLYAIFFMEPNKTIAHYGAEDAPLSQGVKREGNLMLAV